MRLIKNKLLIDLKNTKKEFLLVNILYGYIDILNNDEVNIIKRWWKSGDIVPSNIIEKQFFNELKARNYFLTEEEENDIREKIVQSQKYSDKERLTFSKSASFIFSYACNFRCPYCFEKSNNAEKKQMSLEMVDKVIEIYQGELSHVGFFGGEPLLPANEKIIRYIVKKLPYAYYTVITNGYYLDRFASLIRNINIAMIQVTLDGDRQTHNKSRVLKNGRPTYDKILDNIQSCVAADVPVKIRMNLTEKNIDECYQTREELSNLFKGKKVFFEMQPLFNYSYSRQADFFSKMLREDRNVMAKNIIWKTLPNLSNAIFNGAQLKPVIRFCQSEFQNRFYDCEGDIYSCILSVGEKSKRIGTYYPQLNLKQDSLLTYDITQNGRCNQCSLALLCGGGCPYYIMDDNGKINCTNCENIRNEVENIIPLLYREKYGE